MGRVHALIEAEGKQTALALPDTSRRVVEAALAFMTDEDPDNAYVFSGWSQAGLPHKRLPDGQPWQLRTEHLTLVVEPGSRIQPSGPPIPVGVPYGSRARLILIYLQTEALRTNSREVELGRSLHNWMQRMNIPHGGKSSHDVRKQAELLARCRMSFHLHKGNKRALVNQSIVDTSIFFEDGSDAQGSLFIETARLSEGFYEQLVKHPVPLQEAAIRAISSNSMALDIYMWLAYRLHTLTAPKQLTWKALQAQFGQSFQRLDHFRMRFREPLELALAVYPEASVLVHPVGLTLQPSRPPIARRLIAVGGSKRTQEPPST